MGCNYLSLSFIPACLFPAHSSSNELRTGSKVFFWVYCRCSQRSSIACHMYGNRLIQCKKTSAVIGRCRSCETSTKGFMMTASNGNIFRVTGPLCGNLPVTGEFSSQRPVTRSFDVFFDLRLYKRWSKQSWSWWFETPTRSLWRHCNVVDSITVSLHSPNGRQIASR